MPTTVRFPVLLLTLASAALLAACGGRDDCLGGDCRTVTPCAPVAFTCTGTGFVQVGTVAARGQGIAGPHAQGVGDDVVLENDRVVAVIDALGSPHLLAPSGGNLLDFAAVGQADELNQIYQVAGILPDDALRYDTIETVATPAGGQAVIVRGALDGRPDVKVVTRYELRPCEPGLRVRTELHNGGRDPLTFFLADVAYWGGREPLPFTPLPEQGFVQPKLDLVDLDSSWGRAPFVATDTGLAWVSCSQDRLEGVNDDEVTAIGEPRQIVRPGERVVYERFLIAGDGRSVQAAASIAQEVRRMLGRDVIDATVTGSVVTEGSAPGGRVDLIAEEVTGPEASLPWSQTLAAADGSYALTVPEGGLVRVVAWQFGRPVASETVAAANGATVPPIQVPAPARLHVDVGGRDAAVVLVPFDQATRDATVGTQLGRFEACAPWLGSPHGASPACNRALVHGAADLLVPAGHYFVYASAGPFATLARAEITLVAGVDHDLAFVLTDLRAQLAPGLLSTDLHVHGRASFDSAIPDDDRVFSFVTAGVDAIASTDHDNVNDYAAAIDRLGVGDRVAVIAGLETTGLIPFMKIPGDDFPRVIGHFNFWPVEYDASAPRGGAPWDELLEPGQLFDLMQTVMPADGLMMLNHPWDEPLFGRDLGYLRAVGFDPRLPIPLVDDGTAQGVLARAPGGGHGNLDFDVLEVLNGDSITKFLQYRQIWWALLDQGRVVVGAANSDSHGLSDSQIGWPRNLVATAATVIGFDASVLDADIRAGHMLGGYGIVIDARIGGQSFGTMPVAPAPGATLDVEVRAAPWIPVAEVRFVVNGAVVRTDAVQMVPADPFGEGGLVRYTAQLPLAELLASGGAGAGDAWLLVEAGLPLPAAADLDDDGIVDTTDNDGDGSIDQRDVEDDEDSGPLTDPPDPDPWSEDPRRHVVVVAPGTWPTAFTNPFLIDRDGDGTWSAPGL